MSRIREEGERVEVKWIRSHQKASANEKLEDRYNREGNDAADAVAVEARDQHMPPSSALMRIEICRQYVKDFLKMAANIIIAKSAGEVPNDASPKPEGVAANEKRIKERQERKAESVTQRMMKKGVLSVTKATAEGVKSAYVDPYQGHGVEPDDLQRNWEKAVERERVQQRKNQEHKDAGARIRGVRERVRKRIAQDDDERS